MRAARAIDDVDRELAALHHRHAETCEQIQTLLLMAVAMEHRADILLERRFAMIADDKTPA